MTESPKRILAVPDDDDALAQGDFDRPPIGRWRNK